LALRLPGGASLRLDESTRVVLVSATEVELASGAVYVDSRARNRVGAAVAVHTAAGVFTEVGTQFEVRVERGRARLRVREGRVELDRVADERGAVAAAGEELVVRETGEVERRQVAAYGREWGWTLEAAPVPPIEGISAREFLEWLARERGLRLELAGAEAAAIAESTTLHGSVAHLGAADASRVALASCDCGLVHREVWGRLVVSVARAGTEAPPTPP
jgi:ferric-dicitrate binding protein FerR (iron transport regulator)